MRCIVCTNRVSRPGLDISGAFFITHGDGDVYDPAGMSYLEVFICESCLMNAAGVGDVMEATVTDSDVAFTLWRGEASPTRH